MATQEISIQLLERNAKIYNKKGLRRSFSSFYIHTNEYLVVQPLSARNNVVLEATIDKEFVEDFSNFLKNEGFLVLGDTNYYHLENVCKDYKVFEKYYANQKEVIDTIAKDVEHMKSTAKPYKEIQDEDCIFYFVPKNDKVDTLFEFIGAYKSKILAFAEEKDITIMLKVSGYVNQIDGFFGFNFYDADNKDEEVVIDYASRINVKVDISNRNSVYNAGVLLSAIGDNPEELLAMDTHILADNLKYTKE